ncbi:MAG: toll/interleukin-1 receptor domain-containing protein, partial [Opitutales bacterium]
TRGMDMATPKEYDIFISYAREDGPWVKENLYAPLQRCRLADGRRPRVFFDIGKEGIRQGQSFMWALGEAIQNSARGIQVYSAAYFSKRMTQWELGKMFELDPLGSEGKINPILIEPEAAADVPFLVSDVQYLTVDDADWFDKMLANLGLHLSAAEHQANLVFLTEPTNTTMNCTLPPVRVAWVDATGAPVSSAITSRR